MFGYENVGIRRERYSKEILHKVRSLARNPPKSLWRKPFHRNIIGIESFQSFVPKGCIGKFPVGFKSYEIPPFFLCSKDSLSVFWNERTVKQNTT
jgi:hypothetical protein